MPAQSGILGYEVPIRLGTWQRLTRYGAPRMYSYAWLLGCAWLGLVVMTQLGLRWALGVGVLWLMVQALLAGLTYWNINWDSALLVRWQRKYQPFYRAG